MRIIDLLKEDGILLNANVNSKKEAIEVLVDLMDKEGYLNDKEEYKNEVLKR
ncbi:MAG: PTS sugar transporter subunit IIA, partial [Clostridium baratii]